MSTVLVTAKSLSAYEPSEATYTRLKWYPFVSNLGEMTWTAPLTERLFNQHNWRTIWSLASVAHEYGMSACLHFLLLPNHLLCTNLQRHFKPDSRDILCRLWLNQMISAKPWSRIVQYFLILPDHNSTACDPSLEMNLKPDPSDIHSFHFFIKWGNSAS